MVKLYSIEAERSLLGLLIEDVELVKKIDGFLLEKDFYLSENQQVYNSIIKSFKEKNVVTSTSIIDYLESNSTKTRDDWWKYLVELTYDAGLVANFEQYIKIIRDKTQSRKIRKSLEESIDFIEREQKPIDTVIEGIEEKIFETTRERDLRDFENVGEIAKTFETKMKDFNKFEAENLVMTNIEQLDNLIKGFQKGDFVIIASRPSMGKTAVALEIIRRISGKKKVALFSIEMPSEQIVQRMVSQFSYLDSMKVRNFSNLSSRESAAFKIAVDKIKDLNIWIDDSPALKLGELSWKIRKLDSMEKLDLVVIDYLQLINTEYKGETRQQVVSNISRTLKALARELRIPIVALSQLSRNVEHREDKRPILSDIRESGAIEQDADIIIFLYRKSYYDKNKTQADFSPLEFIVSKHRNGPTGIVRVNFDKKNGRILKMEFNN